MVGGPRSRLVTSRISSDLLERHCVRASARKSVGTDYELVAARRAPQAHSLANLTRPTLPSSRHRANRAMATIGTCGMSIIATARRRYSLLAVIGRPNPLPFARHANTQARFYIDCGSPGAAPPSPDDRCRRPVSPDGQRPSSDGQRAGGSSTPASRPPHRLRKGTEPIWRVARSGRGRSPSPCRPHSRRVLQGRLRNSRVLWRDG